jgi:hypothetical protein
MASNNETIGDFTQVACEAVHTPSNVVLAGREGRVSDPNCLLSASQNEAPGSAGESRPMIESPDVADETFASGGAAPKCRMTCEDLKNSATSFGG